MSNAKPNHPTATNNKDIINEIEDDEQKELRLKHGTFTAAMASESVGKTSTRRQIVEKVVVAKKVTPLVVKPIVELSNHELESVNLTSRNSKNATASLMHSDQVKRQRTESIEEIMKSREFAVSKPKEMLVYDERQRFDSRNSQG